MDYSNPTSKTSQLEREAHETINKLKNFAKNNNELTLELLMDRLNATTSPDEKFVLMLILMLQKKCSSELLLALLYIIS